MSQSRNTFIATVFAVMTFIGLSPALAQVIDASEVALCIGDGTDRCVSASASKQTKLSVRSWMSPDVGTAWAAGHKGKGVTITVVDDFRSADRFYGNLGTGVLLQRHGEWTRLEASMIAPEATMKSKDFYTTSAVTLHKGLDVLNLSYGMYATAGYGVNQIGWSRQETSIINAAANNSAVIAKAAGNDAVAVGGVTEGYQDYLNIALIGKQASLFVGALDANGSPANPADLAWYSNYAGDDARVQSQFLVVGVEGDKTGLYGTSFAAPIVSGYAAILGSKFKTASPNQIANQLLDTARTDTLLNYDQSIFGRGEASLSRALAPRSIK